jgi:putative membrane protein
MLDKRRTSPGRDSDLFKGLAGGLAGGLLASWTMNRFQDVWSSLGRRNQKSQAAPLTQATSDEPDDTTIKAASAISEGLFHHPLTKDEKKLGGTLVHYSLGASVGGLYGAAAEFAPEVTTVAGLPFGAVFWLVVDEGAVPLLGLAKGPAEYPLSAHAYALASHLVFGATTEFVRRTVRRVL